MYYMKCYMQTTILKPNKSQSQVKPTAKSQVKPKPKANKSQQKPKKANKSQRPKAKSQVGMQMGNSGSKMQQIARKTAPG